MKVIFAEIFWKVLRSSSEENVSCYKNIYSLLCDLAIFGGSIIDKIIWYMLFFSAPGEGH
jgi:hypothetical protein